MFLRKLELIFAEKVSKTYGMKHLILFILFTMILSLGEAAAQSQTQKETQTQAQKDAQKETEISVSVTSNRIYIFNAVQGSEFVIKNMLGEKVIKGTIKNEKDTYDLNLNSGFYIIQVGDVLKRVIIK